MRLARGWCFSPQDIHDGPADAYSSALLPGLAGDRDHRRLIAATRAPVWSNGLSRSVLLDQVLVVQNFTQTYGSFAPSWSITNELVYYVMFGLLAAFLARTRVRPATLGMVVCIAVGAVTHFYIEAVIVPRRFSALACSLAWDSTGFWVHWWPFMWIGWCGCPSFACLAILGPFAGTHHAPLVSQRVHLEFIYLGAGIAFTLLLVRFLVVDARAARSLAGSLPVCRLFSASRVIPRICFTGHSC